MGLILANLMKRDPRMVERKKTGLAKARKAVCILHSGMRCGVLNRSPTVHLGQALNSLSCRHHNLLWLLRIIHATVMGSFRYGILARCHLRTRSTSP